MIVKMGCAKMCAKLIKQASLVLSRFAHEILERLLRFPPNNPAAISIDRVAAHS